MGQTTAILDGNVIKGGDKNDENSNSNGLQIKDQAEPELRNNKIMWVKKDLDCEPRKHFKKMIINKKVQNEILLAQTKTVIIGNVKHKKVRVTFFQTILLIQSLVKSLNLS